jgi:hypothetical protein
VAVVHSYTGLKINIDKEENQPTTFNTHQTMTIKNDYKRATNMDNKAPYSPNYNRAIKDKTTVDMGE